MPTAIKDTWLSVSFCGANFFIFMPRGAAVDYKCHRGSLGFGTETIRFAIKFKYVKLFV